MATGLIPDVENGNPNYGAALATGDFDANGHDDLAIGAPKRDQPPSGFIVLPDAGGVAVLYGSNGQLLVDGFESGNTVRWQQFPL